MSDYLCIKHGRLGCLFGGQCFFEGSLSPCNGMLFVFFSCQKMNDNENMFIDLTIYLIIYLLNHHPSIYFWESTGNIESDGLICIVKNLNI